MARSFSLARSLAASSVASLAVTGTAVPSVNQISGAGSVSTAVVYDAVRGNSVSALPPFARFSRYGSTANWATTAIPVAMAKVMPTASSAGRSSRLRAGDPL